MASEKYAGIVPGSLFLSCALDNISGLSPHHVKPRVGPAASSRKAKAKVLRVIRYDRVGRMSSLGRDVMSMVCSELLKYVCTVSASKWHKGKSY